MTASHPTLARNLGALVHVDREFARRLCLPVEGDHLELGGKDGPMYRWHRSRFSLDVTDVDSSGRFSSVPASKRAQEKGILVFGVGLGEQTARLLEQYDDVDVVAWDRDPAVLRTALMRNDFAEAIESGRLRLLLGIDILDEIGTDRVVVYHPLLRQIYSWEARLMVHGMGDHRALVCAGGLLVDDIARSLTVRGFSVYTWDVERQSADELRRTAERFEPEFVIAINHTHGLAEACHGLGIQLLMWEIDPAIDRLRQCRTTTDHVRVFTYRRSQVPEYIQAGFSHVQYMPLATDPSRRSPPIGAFDPDRDSDGTVRFVGSSMVAQAEQYRNKFLAAYDIWRGVNSEGHHEGEDRLDDLLTLQRRDPMAYRVPTLLRERFPGFMRAAADLLREDPVAMVGEMAASHKRLDTISRLDRFGVEVWGDEGWRAIARDGVFHKGYAGHGRALTGIYGGGGIHIDIGRLYQADIVTMRVFDILACGGFVIAEYSDALDDLFEIGVDIESWRTVDELIEKIAHYRTYPDHAQEIARRGRDTVWRCHSIGLRLETMLHSLRSDGQCVLAG